MHDRQLVILDREVYSAWLDPKTPPDDALQLLHENLEFHRVDRPVNASTSDKQRNDDPSMIKPLTPA